MPENERGRRAQDASTVLWNPAEMTRLEDAHILIGTDFGFFDTEFDLEGATPIGAGTGDGVSLNSFAPIAGAFVATTVDDELRFGLSLNALYAGSVDYDNDWAFGANVAALLEPREGTRIGIQYRTKAEAKLQGDVDIPLPLSPNIDLELTLPQEVNVSLYHQLTPALALLGDAGWSDWSKFGSIPVSMGPIATAQERDWKDTWRVA